MNMTAPYAMVSSSYRLRFALAVCLLGALVLAIAPIASAQFATSSGVRQSYGNFSIVWPAQPHLVQQQAVSGGVAAIYALIQPSITYTFSFLQFSSPQEMVSPQDFARNQTSNPPGETILSVSATKVSRLSRR